MQRPNFVQFSLSARRLIKFSVRQAVRKLPEIAAEALRKSFTRISYAFRLLGDRSCRRYSIKNMSLTLSPFDFQKRPYTAMVLFQTDVDKVEDFMEIWNNAAFRVAVDGGTNHWHSLTKDAKVKDPSIVCGDFDSISSDVKRFAEESSTIKVIPTPDQDHTDFTKALQILQKEEDAPRTIVALVSNRAGRYDQQFSNINTLVKSLNWGMTIFLYDHVNIIFPIPANVKTELRLRSNLVCGIIPIDGPTRIHSQGLKWDLADVYRFGGIVSTSNQIVEDTVVLEAERPLIFTVESHLLSS